MTDEDRRIVVEQMGPNFTPHRSNTGALSEAFAHLVAAGREAGRREASAWRPIDDAAREADAVLGWGPHLGFRVVSWGERLGRIGFCWHSCEGQHPPGAIIRYIPLPDEPADD